MTRFILILLLAISPLFGQQRVDLCRASSFQYYAVEGFPNSTYEWYIDSSLINQSGNVIGIQWPEDTTRTYAIKVREISEYNCEGPYRALYVTVSPCFTLYIPNCITINGDGLNETFSIYGEQWEFTAFYVTIHNRWGAQVFSSDSPYFQWDGTYNGEPVPQDVYTYRITYTQNKKPYYDNILGQLTLLR